MQAVGKTQQRRPLGEAFIIDVDGTITFGGKPLPGAAEAIATLKQEGIPVRFASNDTHLPRSKLVADLRAAGIDAEERHCFTAQVAAITWLKARGARRVCLFMPEATHVDFSDFEITERDPEYVLVGDLGEEWSFDLLNKAFCLLHDGAKLVAAHRNRYWDPGEGIRLDAGPFVAALEYASGKQATVVGKPSRSFFEAAAADLGVPLSHVAVVGDSLEVDVGGAQAAGCAGVLVRTGVFRAEQLDSSPVVPDITLSSLAELPRWLGL